VKISKNVVRHEGTWACASIWVALFTCSQELPQWYGTKHRFFRVELFGNFEHALSRLQQYCFVVSQVFVVPVLVALICEANQQESPCLFGLVPPFSGHAVAQVQACPLPFFGMSRLAQVDPCHRKPTQLGLGSKWHVHSSLPPDQELRYTKAN
jgi:hypothetical protein